MTNAARLLSWGLGVGLSSILLSASAASAQPLAGEPCSPQVADGARFRFEEEAGTSLPATTCPFTGLRCEPPEAGGGRSYVLVDPVCDPTGSTPCEVQVRVPIRFPGNQGNIGEGVAAMEVRWFAQSEAPSCSDPVDCGQVSTCGKGSSGAGTINTDRATFTATYSLTCSEIRHGSLPVSLTAWACVTSTDCRQRLDVNGLDLDGDAVAAAIGCPIPPMESCNGDPVTACGQCLPGGLAVGGGGPGVGGGTHLYYAAGGAGRAGLPGAVAWSAILGRGWSHDYALRVVSETPDDSRVSLITRYATFRTFWDDDLDGIYDRAEPSNEHRTLTRTAGGWELAELDGTVHLFDGGGLWLATTDRNGSSTTAVYSGGVLARAHFPDGRREEFEYHPVGAPDEGKLATITEVGIDGSTSRTWSYAWTGEDLTRVDRPDGTAILYTYGDPQHPGFLTRIELEGADGTSRRVARAWEYDAEGNAVASWRGDVSKTGPDAVDVWELAFDDPILPTVTTVTDPLGRPITYQLDRDTVSLNAKVLSSSGDCPVCDLSPSTVLAYGDPAHPLLPTSATDGRGITTVMSYDAAGQLVSRTEAVGELEERTTLWTYNPAYPGLATSVEVPSVAGGAALRTTGWIRDTAGNPTTRRITGMEAGSAFSYDTVATFNAAGQPLTLDPPGHGAADVTSWSYDPARGDLIAESRTDPVVGVTSFAYDPFNRRTSVTDPNGVETTTTYDALDRVIEIRRLGASPPTGDLVTTHEQTTFGDLFQTSFPAGNVIEYGYDSAGRLTSIERKPDASTHGERTLYTLDGAGNRTREALQRWDSGTAAWATVSETVYEYSSRCQVDRVVQAPGAPEEAVTELSYDAGGNLERVWDQNHSRLDPGTGAELPETALYQYDALDRAISVRQPWGGEGGGFSVTGYQYDVQDHLTRITDAQGNVTTYTVSDRDLVTHELAEAFVDPAAVCNPAPACDPGCGCRRHAYDQHGVLVSTTDARGITVARTVDPLDRVTFVDYPGTALDTTYLYDTQPAVCGGVSYSAGRIGSIVRDGRVVEYCHDRFGRAIRDGELTFGHDANGNRTTIGYPGGVVASYGFDLADRPVSLLVTSLGGTEPVVSTAGYIPDGLLSSLLLGSGTVETRTYDGRQAPAVLGIEGDPARVGNHAWAYRTDPAGNVLEIVERAVCPHDPLVLENQTVTTEIFTSCSDLESGNGFTVGASGNVTFEAEGIVKLTNGFTVGSGALFEAASGGIRELSRRTNAYQDVQYFLAAARGPWLEPADWTYDRIGNRLSETPLGAGDVYRYRANSVGEDTPILEWVELGTGNTRAYTWDAVGNLEQVAPGANLIDFSVDAAGRMSAAGRPAAGEAVAFAYDGRGFLRRAEQTAGGTASVEPVYDSAGLVHALRRRSSATANDELVLFFYLGSNLDSRGSTRVPVAQLAIDGTGTERWTYFTTDHLGTPLLATDAIGTVVWEGGFRPFGRDYRQGTPRGALQNGIYLRLPGQWEDSIWQNATSGAEVYDNVHRWYAPAIGRYTRPDPIGSARGHLNPYLYAGGNPILEADPLGLRAGGPSWRCRPPTSAREQVPSGPLRFGPGGSPGDPPGEGSLLCPFKWSAELHAVALR